MVVNRKGSVWREKTFVRGCGSIYVWSLVVRLGRVGVL